MDNNLVKRTELEKINDKLFIKDESQQTGGSFKIRGVSYTIYNFINEEIKKDNSNRTVYLVTQSTGNHAIAHLATLLHFKELGIKNSLITFIGVIFGIKHTPENKKKILKDLTNRTNSILDFSANDYNEALQKRNNFMKKYDSRYVGHGDKMIMEGYSFTADEIHEQLLSYNISVTAKINLLLPIGAGGLIGIANKFKKLRPNSNIVIVQTVNLSSFIKSYRMGTKDNIRIIKNDEFPIDNEGKTIYPYADGIAVDAPEIDALRLAYDCVDSTFIISELDSKKSINNNQILNSFVGSSRMIINAYFKMVQNGMIDHNSITIMFLTERK